MNVVEFAEYLVKSIVLEPDLVKVSEFQADADEDVTILEILVPEKEMGRVIGKNGKTSTSLRTLIQAFAAVKKQPKVKINIDSFWEIVSISFFSWGGIYD